MYTAAVIMLQNKVKGSNIKNNKAIIVTDKLPNKYNINIGTMFDSCKQLAEYCNVSVQSIVQWKKKGWIKDC